jgi:hypothetical protein
MRVMVQRPRQATMWFDFRPVRTICVCVGGTYIFTQALRAKVVGTQTIFFRCSGEESLVGQGHVVESLEGNAQGSGESLR